MDAPSGVRLPRVRVFGLRRKEEFPKQPKDGKDKGRKSNGGSKQGRYSDEHGEAVGEDEGDDGHRREDEEAKDERRHTKSDEPCATPKKRKTTGWSCRAMRSPSSTYRRARRRARICGSI